MSLVVKVKKAVKGFSLDVDFSTDGQVLGILGASGCGKSMTLKCIAGILTPDEGYIELNGKVLFDSAKKINVKPQNRNVGYLFQNYALFPNMTVEQNIAAGLSRGGFGRVNEMISLFRLQGLEKHRPNQLSGGQQQRVALARMLAYEPEVMLFDEPFSALDAYLKEELQLEMHKALESCHGESILVTHSRDEVYELCKKAAVMSAGHLLKMDDVKHLFHNPGKVEVARMTGCKNITKVKFISEHIVEALDWGIRLHVNAKGMKHISHIGIRAHDLKAAEPGSEPVNRIPCHVIKISEAPFEWNVLLKTSHSEEHFMWWKIGKNKLENPLKMPETLTIAPEDILLLEK